MTKKKQHISEEDFQRYLEHKMTDTERNAFERELQKNPFEADALEGLRQISPEVLKSDLLILQSKIKPAKRKTKYRYWTAAATLLLLISSGIIWIQLKENPSVSEISENKTLNLQEEVSVESEKIPIENFEEEPEMPAEVPTPIKPKEIKPETKQKPVQLAKAQPQQKEAKAEITEKDSPIVIRGLSQMADKKQTNDFVSTQELSMAATVDKEVIRGKIISVVDSQPIPGVTILEKGGKSGVITDVDGNFELQLSDVAESTFVASFIGMETKEFHPTTDSVNIIELVPSQLALDEVVLIGYGNQKNKKALTGSASKLSQIKNAEVQPVDGIDAYEKYLAEKAVLPETYKQKREVIKVLINFDETGEITEIASKNNSDSLLFELAKNIIETGPKWNPEIKNGEPVKSQTELKIVFRKKE